MFAVIPSPVAISCIGIGIQQVEKAPAGKTSRAIASAIDTNLDRSAMTVCIVLSADDVFCD
jgi:hypothetical protein